MLLAIDVGNTNVVFALFERAADVDKPGAIRARWRIATDPRRTADEYAVWLMQLLAIEGVARDSIDAIVVATVVPRALHNIDVLATKYFKVAPLVAGVGKAAFGMDIDVDDPRSLGADRFVVLTDNGFGSKANSADSLLMFNYFKLDWAAGKVNHEESVFLSDPNKLVPFPIVTETTDRRYLTGADFDIESIQLVGDSVYFGDELGPWLIKTDKAGVVQAVYKTSVGGIDYKAPDNAFNPPPNAGATAKGTVTQRSGGFEGMALSPDGKTLYPLLEKTFYDEAKGAMEQVDGKPAIRMLQFDVATGAFADKIRYYPLEDATDSIGDFNLIDDHRALIIERDQNQGDARDGWPKKPAKLKRVYMVDINQLDANNVVKKLGYIDLLDIKDPKALAPRGSKDGVFTFPFDTIENVDRVDDTHIVVANDNNYPFDVSREEGKQDDEEFILLDVADFLKAE